MCKISYEGQDFAFKKQIINYQLVIKYDTTWVNFSIFFCFTVRIFLHYFNFTTIRRSIKSCDTTRVNVKNGFQPMNKKMIEKLLKSLTDKININFLESYNPSYRFPFTKVLYIVSSLQKKLSENARNHTRTEL